MSNGWQVTAQDIKESTRTNRRRAQEKLPLLVRKLILASVNSSSLSFPDGVWPHEAVRDVIEKYENRDIETGIEVGLYSQRGTTWRGVAKEEIISRTLLKSTKSKPIKYNTNGQELLQF